MELEELRKRRKNLNQQSSRTLDNMYTIAKESERVAEVAHNSKAIIDNLESEFESQTGLIGVDVSFLFFATALQCIRQYVLSNESFRFNKASDADKLIEKPLREISNTVNIKKDYKEILLGSVPYDIIPSRIWNTGINVQNHRELTLGHDPLFGWIFGTINIMTDSLTKKDLLLSSYIISGKDIESISNFPFLLSQSIVAFQQDYKILIAAVAKQAIHYASDVFTKKGLPLPILNNVSPDFNSELIKSHIDLYSVTRSATISILINALIAAIHGLFYDKSKYSDREIYEVKTRKILSYSNLIASASNVIYVAASSYLGDKNTLKKLDLGGLIVTIYRLIKDVKFIQQVKEEFVFGGFNKMIKGEKYTF
ncbi:hypothetical protein ACPUYX_17615 [Desulfosporosinus sp. SYSU MS00001]|uniref:hypothetical protein n=1 Tax=Desulfosporosinus sp. SYSU MS00001 TaxID=3416284 RepID=UPI003CED0713